MSCVLVFKTWVGEPKVVAKLVDHKKLLYCVNQVLCIFIHVHMAARSLLLSYSELSRNLVWLNEVAENMNVFSS